MRLPISHKALRRLKRVATWLVGTYAWITLGAFGIMLCAREAQGDTFLNAAKVVYRATGSGSVLSSITSALGLEPNVAYYGAVCNGSADDHAHIQDATNANVRVRIPAAVCSTGSTTISPPSGHSLVGVGMQSSIIKYAGTGCAFSFDGADGGGLRDLKITTPGSSSTERGLCLTNAIGPTLRNWFEHLFIASLTNPPTTGSYGIFFHSTTTNSLYYNTFFHVFTLDYDRGIELLGDPPGPPTTGGANANWFYGYSANADNVGIYFDGLASDNYVQGHCNASGQTFAQKCFVIGDGTNTSAGNEVHMVTDQGTGNGGFTVNNHAVNNFVWQVNEGGGTDSMSGDSSNFMFDTNTIGTTGRSAWLPSGLFSGNNSIGGPSNATFIGGSIRPTRQVHNANANYTMAVGDNFIGFNSFAAPHTLTLAANSGHEIWVADEDGTVTGTNTLTIAAPSGGSVNRSPTLVLSSLKLAHCKSTSTDGKTFFCVAQ